MIAFLLAGAAALADPGARPAGAMTLQRCIEIALKENLELKIARAELARAQGARTGSLGKFLPAVTLTASEQRSTEREATLVGLNRVETRTTFETQELTATVSQELPSGAIVDVTHLAGPDQKKPSDTRSRGIEATLTQPLLKGAGLAVSLAGVRSSGWDVRARELDLNDLERQTVRGVKVAYYNVLRDRELLRVNRSTLDADSLLVQASNAMVEAKVASRRDVLSARIRLSDDATSVVVAERDEQLSLDLLKNVMGVPLETPIEVADLKLEAKGVPLDEAALIRSVIETHPAIQSARFGVKRSRLDLTVARNATLPQIDLQASYLGSLEQSAPSDEIRGKGWLAAVNVHYPLFDRAAVGAARERDAALSQAEDRLKQLERELTLRVRDIVRTVRSSSEEVQAIQRTIEAADEKMQFATAMFNLGRASNLDITDARGDLVKARTQLVKKLVDYNSQLALLESLTGKPVGP